MKYIISDESATIFANGRIVTIRHSHPNWKAVTDAIRANDENTALRLADVERTVQSWTASSPNVTVRGGQVLYKNNPVHDVITTRILRMIREGFDPSPLINFLEKVKRNPSHRAVEELYKFLEHNNLPIDPDGDFYGYKRIRHDWMDVYSGTISNHIGAHITKPRNEVDDDPTRTCSVGLHIASLGYLAHYDGERLVLTKQSPEHVVSVPIDYHNTKMRVCDYTVHSELDMETIAETDANWKSVYASPPKDTEDNQYDEDDESKETPFDPTSTPLTTI